jgi:hypothetical protein
VIRTRLRTGVAAVRDVLLGSPERAPLESLIGMDRRWPVFLDAVSYVNAQRIQGAIAEFGVYGGVSLALLAHAHAVTGGGLARRVVGADSFAGLPASEHEHPRWRRGAFATNLWWHPTLALGEPVTAGAVRALFTACRLPEPDLLTGLFHESLPPLIPSRHPALALVHIDCDLYESTRDVLEAIAPALQDGAMVLFDDWFLFKGDPTKGEARALREFLERRPEWAAAQYRAYSTCCNAFILRRR